MPRVETFPARTPSAEDPVLGEIVRRLVSAYQPEKIYLFGSVARGEADPDSDFDIMVVVPDEARDQLQDCDAAYEVLRGLGIAKDILVWKHSDFQARLALRASLPSTIIQQGKLLYAA